MTSPVTVSERDLRTLLGIVSDGRSDLPAVGCRFPCWPS
jgi:hypothetical protein